MGFSLDEHSSSNPGAAVVSICLMIVSQPLELGATMVHGIGQTQIIVQQVEDMRQSVEKMLEFKLSIGWERGKHTSKRKGLADRLSKVADVPVAPDDGLTKFICGICNRKFLLAESFITTAKASYEKSNASPSGTGGTIGSQAQVSRKRTKALRHLLTLPSVDLWPSD
eukprot:Em0022g363a